MFFVREQTLIRARQGTDLGPEGASQLGKSHLPHQDVVDSLCSMAEALMKGDSTEEAEGDLTWLGVRCMNLRCSFLRGVMCLGRQYGAPSRGWPCPLPVGMDLPLGRSRLVRG